MENQYPFYESQKKDFFILNNLHSPLLAAIRFKRSLNHLQYFAFSSSKLLECPQSDDLLSWLVNL